MKKVLSVLLVAILLFAMIPTTAFAATAPTITASASKTTVVAGDTVKITVKIPANSNLVAFQYIVKYSTSYFQLVDGSMSLGGTFGYEGVNTATAGTIKYAGAAGSKLTKASTLFTVEFKIVKPGGKRCESSSHIPRVDLKACFQGAASGYIRQRRNSRDF